VFLYEWRLVNDISTLASINNQRSDNATKWASLRFWPRAKTTGIKYAFRWVCSLGSNDTKQGGFRNNIQCKQWMVQDSTGIAFQCLCFGFHHSYQKLPCLPEFACIEDICWIWCGVDELRSNIFHKQWEWWFLWETKYYGGSRKRGRSISLTHYGIHHDWCLQTANNKMWYFKRRYPAINIQFPIQCFVKRIRRLWHSQGTRRLSVSIIFYRGSLFRPQRNPVGSCQNK